MRMPAWCLVLAALARSASLRLLFMRCAPVVVAAVGCGGGVLDRSMPPVGSIDGGTPADGAPGQKMNVWTGTATMTIVISDSHTTTSGSTTSDESATENTSIVLMLETTAGRAPGVSGGPFMVTNGSVSLSRNDT